MRDQRFGCHWEFPASNTGGSHQNHEDSSLLRKPTGFGVTMGDPRNALDLESRDYK